MLLPSVVGQALPGSLLQVVAARQHSIKSLGNCQSHRQPSNWQAEPRVRHTLIPTWVFRTKEGCIFALLFIYRQPSIVEIQILRVGQFVILCVPGELTTMAGRRLREAMQAQVQHGYHALAVVFMTAATTAADSACVTQLYSRT